MNSFTFGQYIPGNSFVHSLDSRTKLYLVVVSMAAVLGANTLLGVVITTLFTGLFILSSSISVRTYWHGMRPLIIVVAIAAAFQIFFVPGEVIYRWWIFSVSDAGAKMGALMTYRLIMVFVLAELLTFTTSPLQLTDGLERILRPLNKLGVPAHELAMIMTIALRFIPVFFEEADKITMAQISRGADFSGGWVKKTRNLVAIIVPLFVRAFRRADELALAMESRCYTGGEGRTRLHEAIMSPADYGVIAVTTGMVLAIILSGV
ncbi:MAG: energy-coupling factor transporter transmembrane component T family protein [Bacillota bacterium]